MALSIDWNDTNTISVLQADLDFVSGTLYDLDTDWFRLALKALEDDEQGMVWPDTHVHNPEVTISGTTYARQVIILSPYKVQFEDTGSAYTVRTVGSNNNILDIGAGILTPTPLVTTISTNAAGLVVYQSGSGLTSTQADDLLLLRKLATNRRVLSDGTSGNLVYYDDDDIATLLTYNVTDESDGAIALGAGDPAKQSKGV